MNDSKTHRQIASLVLAASLLACSTAMADAVSDWNVKAGEIIVDARMGPPPANRVMAIVHTAVYEAVNAITKRYPGRRVETGGGARGISRCRDRSGEPHRAHEAAPVSAGGYRHRVSGSVSKDRRRSARRPRASPWVNRPRRPSLRRAPTTVLPRGSPTGPTPQRVSTCPRSYRRSRTGRSASPG